LEASALTHASRRGLLARRSPLLKLQGDPRLIAMARTGNAGAFEAIVDRYQGRLLGFCRQMLGSTEDAEDVLQEVFVNAHRAMMADEREINLRPWLYRIARNRCLNHLRKPTADAQESMDMVPVVEAAATAEKVHNREEFRQLLDDVGKLPETQRSALLLREMDGMSYEEIAAAMETSVPSVKSLLVRARISLAEASQARQLTCGEVRLELAEAAEGLRKASPPVRRHVRDCEECADFRAQVRSNDKTMAALFPAGPLVALKAFLVSKLGLGGAGGGATGGAGAAAGAGAGATATAGAGAVGTVGTVGAALGGSGAAGGIGAVGGAIGSKAVAGALTAAALTAGAVGVQEEIVVPPATAPKASTPFVEIREAAPLAPAQALAALPLHEEPVEVVATPEPSTEPVTEPTPVEAAPPEAETPPATEEAVATLEAGEESATVDGGDVAVTGAKTPTGVAGAPTGGNTVVVTVGTSPSSAPPATASPPPASAPPASDPPASAPPSSAPPASEPAPPAAAPSTPAAPAPSGAAEEASDIESAPAAAESPAE
jgi:RNA polymerase sigma factor (sigma-70 family)